MLVEKINKGDSSAVFVYTTCRDREEARLIGLECIRNRLAVCSDFWEINSVYPWNGVIEEVSQYMLMLTTEKRLSPELISFIGTIHSYTTPMISELDVALMNSSYKFWADTTLDSREDYVLEEDISREESNTNIEKLK